MENNQIPLPLRNQSHSLRPLPMRDLLLKLLLSFIVVLSLHVMRVVQLSSLSKQHRYSVNSVYNSLHRMLSWRSKNNTVFIMITDYGYLSHFYNCYSAGRLSQYDNLIVACLDVDCYSVRAPAASVTRRS